MAKRGNNRSSTKRSEATAYTKRSAALAEAGYAFHRRGWLLGTSGNLSAVLTREPLRLIVTASGVDKGTLTAKKFLEIDQETRVLRGTGKPSAEALLHLVLVRKVDAGAVLHTHSIWNTILSEVFAHQGGMALTGYEMLKGLSGVATHEHREWLPILENSQDIPALARRLEATLERHPGSHGFLLRGHGLYTWGRDISEARRHVEILEFLLEVKGRTHSMAGSAAAASGAR